MEIRYIQDFKERMKGKRVLVRVDFNVPLDEEGYVIDDNRIREAIPTIEYVLENNGKPILMSHLGRPSGQAVENLRMCHVGEKLSELLSIDVVTLDHWNFKKISDTVKSSRIVLLENLRFKKEEEKKCEADTKKRKAFAEKLASLADLYINDAFGTCHRDDTSVYYVPLYLPSAAGLLVQRELKELQALVHDHGGRFNVILGGAKVTDKIGIIENLYESVEKFFIGGKMCLAFLRAKGLSIGAAEIDEKDYEEAGKILEEYGGEKIMLPTDMIVADDDAKDAEHKRVAVEKMPPTWFPLDIGEDTILSWKRLIGNSSSFFWNGPLGRCEYGYSKKGTQAIAESVISYDLRGIIGGGDTLASIDKSKFNTKKVFFSTGGGATLDYLAGAKMPALEALQESYIKFRQF